jgi:hypothetical protein
VYRKTGDEPLGMALFTTGVRAQMKTSLQDARGWRLVSAIVGLWIDLFRKATRRRAFAPHEKNHGSVGGDWFGSDWGGILRG